MRKDVHSTASFLINLMLAQASIYLKKLSENFEGEKKLTV